jgi:hypothetical protein
MYITWLKLLSVPYTRWLNWLRHWASRRKVAGSIPDDVPGIFHLHNPYGSGVDSASNRNKYQEYFLGVKADGV